MKGLLELTNLKLKLVVTYNRRVLQNVEIIR